MTVKEKAKLKSKLELELKKIEYSLESYDEQIKKAKAELEFLESSKYKQSVEKIKIENQLKDLEG